ncbi:MAG: efflux RND transporter periplasmic adaptor subunit [Sporomusaceae bacterium]|nr:efflux RND transporter periplasmic adaptor subunit [Sporomusaceae bacterium]
MKNLKLKKWLLPVVALLGFVIIWRSGVLAGGKDLAQPADTALTVNVTAAQYVDSTPGLNANATLEGRTSAAISAKIAGRIERVLVQEGQQVKAGEPLLELETVELANSVRQAGDSVRKAQASYDLALNDFNRYQTLYEKGAVSEQQLDNAKAKLKTAEADLSSATANESSAKQQYSDGVISAPVDGVIANRTATVGQVVSPGAALMLVQDINQIYAVINVEQKDLGRVKLGQSASISVDSYPGKLFTGEVAVMNPEAGSGSRMFRTKILIDNSDGELKPGMFAKASLATGESVRLLTIPQSAVVQKQGLYHVFTLENGKAIRRQIEAGEIMENTIAVKSGLEAGQQVITSSVSRLKDGDAVQPAQN